jgi:hypothetical protein
MATEHVIPTKSLPRTRSGVGTQYAVPVVGKTRMGAGLRRHDVIRIRN